MFKFNFINEENGFEEVPKSTNKLDEPVTLNAPCSEIDVSESEVHVEYNFEPISIGNLTFHVRDLERSTRSEDTSFLNSFKSHDVIPNVYEGGLKVWECTYDLLTFLSQNDVNFSHKTVLDLGCGAGLLGIYAASKNAKRVHFQDYNADVLKMFTIPNVKRNDVRTSTKFFSGDWDSFSVQDSPEHVYDYILCSEVLYNASSYPKLGNLFERKLHPGGKVIMASKSYYFGVGGSVKQFEQFLREKGTFSWQTVWKTEEGVQREILFVEKLNVSESHVSNS